MTADGATPSPRCLAAKDRCPPTADPGGAELNRFGGYDARRGLILHRDRNRIRCDRGRARIRDRFQMPPVTAAGETTDASRARPKPPPGRVATATVDAFKRQQGILGGMLEFRDFDQPITIAS